MLNDLINKVAEKTGISNEAATTAVTTVLNFLKKKLPEPIASQIDGFLNGTSEPDSDVVEQVKEKASDIYESAKEKLGSIFKK